MVGASDRVGDATPDGEQVKDNARRAAGVAQENPLGLAVGSIAVGFIVGMLVPSSRVEDRKLGPIADDVKEKAKETGQEALERGQQVAQEAAQSAQQTVQEKGREHGERARLQRPAEHAGGHLEHALARALAGTTGAGAGSPRPPLGYLRRGRPTGARSSVETRCPLKDPRPRSGFRSGARGLPLVQYS